MVVCISEASLGVDLISGKEELKSLVYTGQLTRYERASKAACHARPRQASVAWGVVRE